MVQQAKKEELDGMEQTALIALMAIGFQQNIDQEKRPRSNSLGKRKMNAREERCLERNRITARNRRARKTNRIKELEIKVNHLHEINAPLHAEMERRSITEIKRPVLLQIESMVLPSFATMLDHAKSCPGQVLEEKSVFPLTHTSREGIRRERNRISAKMSRLRKKVRLSYLEEALKVLQRRNEILRVHCNRDAFSAITHP